LRVLILKVTSLGDVIHTLPALTDAAKALPGIVFDWAVDESYAEVPAWHGSVDRVITLGNRRWRRAPWRAVVHGELWQFVQSLRRARYDWVLDVQGQLSKTIWIASLARGVRCGYDWASVREPLASLAYQRKFAVAKGQHAVERTRQLFAQALGYAVPAGVGDYGIDRETRFETTIDPGLLVFLHATSWSSKLWPVSYWADLIRLAGREGYRVLLTWGNAEEKERAAQLASGQGHVILRTKSTLAEIARDLASAGGVVAVDTGLCHLAAALGVPTVSLYGPTSTGLTGAYGSSQHYIEADFSCAPCFLKRCNYPGPSNVEPACFEALTPERVWRQLMAVV
jgi:heptosyltransferase-1